MRGVDSEETSVLPPSQDGRVALNISADCMEVRATVTPPLHGGVPVTVEQVLVEMEADGVTFGVDPEAILEAVSTAERDGREGRQVVVARGRAPVPGEDAAVEYHELLQTPSGYPQIRDDGTADFFALNMVRNVQEGMVLATRRPPGKGQVGTDVLGRTLPAADGRDVRLRAGTGARLSPDGQSVLAAMEGHASVDAQGEIRVSPVFVVEGDVDYSTGNIDFVGTVVIRGDLSPGFAVKAGQNVEVHGGVMGGIIEAGGDVMVRYGIIGGGRGEVTAGGKVQCRFVEGGEIRAGTDVAVVEGILNARVSAVGKVSVSGSRGSIIGGRIRARTEVSARVLGSPAGTPTEIQVGLLPEVRIELEQVRRELRQVEARLNRAVQAATFLQEMAIPESEGRNSASRQGLRQALRSQHQAQAEREQLHVRLGELQAVIEQEKGAHIRASDLAYPGVRIVIGTERYLVVDPCHHSRFFLSGEGQVEIAPA